LALDQRAYGILQAPHKKAWACICSKGICSLLLKVHHLSKKILVHRDYKPCFYISILSKTYASKRQKIRAISITSFIWRYLVLEL